MPTAWNSMKTAGLRIVTKIRPAPFCLVHLYALEGAIMNVEFNSLSEDKKKELKAFSDFLNA